MPDLAITVDEAEAVPFAASPMLAFKLSVANKDAAEAIHTVVLRCQIQIEVTRRRYTAEDQARLRDLFGEPDRWGQTCATCCGPTPAWWCRSSRASTTVDLQVPCTFDFNVATTKYFNGLDGRRHSAAADVQRHGFLRGRGRGRCTWRRFPGTKKPKFRLPLKVWKDMMDSYYPNIAWLCLRRDVFEELAAVQSAQRDADAGSRRSRGCWQPPKEDSVSMNIETVEKIADRGAVRRLHAVSVPAVGGEESAALQFRSALSARLLRGLGDDHRVPGAGDGGGFDRSEGSIPADDARSRTGRKGLTREVNDASLGVFGARAAGVYIRRVRDDRRGTGTADVACRGGFVSGDADRKKSGRNGQTRAGDRCCCGRWFRFTVFCIAREASSFRCWIRRSGLRRPRRSVRTSARGLCWPATKRRSDMMLCVADHSLRLSADRAGEPRRFVRRHWRSTRFWRCAF